MLSWGVNCTKSSNNGLMSGNDFPLCSLEGVSLVYDLFCAEERLYLSCSCIMQVFWFGFLLICGAGGACFKQTERVP